MILDCIPPKRALNKGYLKQNLQQDIFASFRLALAGLLSQVPDRKFEDTHAHSVAEFLKDTWYKGRFEINTKEREDLVIHNGKTARDSAGVVFELKSPTNQAEMIRRDAPGAKALYELVHHYFAERLGGDGRPPNQEVKHLIATNVVEWFIFDATEFERAFYANKPLRQSYVDWKEKRLAGTTTEWLYAEILAPFVRASEDRLRCAYVDLAPLMGIPAPVLDDDDALVPVFKLLSPEHLLKLPFANDSNTLNRDFYEELLYILGLEEGIEGSRRIICRRAEAEAGSLIENATNLLRVRGVLANLGNPEHYGATEEEQLFSIGLELCITWLNRILFLKLLEGQLLAYHGENAEFAFLNSQRISDFDDLEELFFEVLAVKPDQRSPQVRERYGRIPFLNSSLFEISDLEAQTIHIAALKDRLELPLFARTVLRDPVKGKRLSGSRRLLDYLFAFLDAYDFATEGRGVLQAQPKTIINAAVLGLIFEKINGYKEGSYFTPGYISVYICRETLRQAVVQRFNEALGWQCQDFEGLRDRIDASYKERGFRQRANEIVNSIRICDPAVGSGHFLVSALNELIAIKHDLHILSYAEPAVPDERQPTPTERVATTAGARVTEYSLTVENDELIVLDEDDALFEYRIRTAGKPAPAMQRLQETLFHEKRTLIENCLFGVDINPKSVAICRLRLWIELLKHAYYRGESGYTELETLPNIDINIKCGNSLISRFDIHGFGGVALQDRPRLARLVHGYKEKVRYYKLCPSLKSQVRKEIETLKAEFESFAVPGDPDFEAYLRKRVQAGQLFFALDPKDKELAERYAHELAEAEAAWEEKRRTLYGNAFEWRFEFPEVLGDDGEFTGFDVVIGNPPYIRQEWLNPYKPILQRQSACWSGTADAYLYFLERGLQVLRPGGRLGFITSGTFGSANFAAPFRQWLPTVARFVRLVNFGENQPFADAEMVFPTISIIHKDPTPRPFRSYFMYGAIPDSIAAAVESEGIDCDDTVFSRGEWRFQPAAIGALFDRLMAVGRPLSEVVAGRIYYGVKTGLNEAFVVDQATRDRLVRADPGCAPILRRMLRGEDLRPWYYEDEGRWLIFTRRGIDIDRYPAVKAHLEAFRESLEPKPDGWREVDAQGRRRTWSGRKPGSYAWYEIQDSVDYYGAFDEPKILWPDIAKLPRFSWDTDGVYVGNTGYLMPGEPWLLAMLSSRLLWFCISQLSTPLRLRAGLWQFRCFSQFMERLPIVTPERPGREALADLATRATVIARERYALHRQVRRAIADALTTGAVPGGATRFVVRPSGLVPEPGGTGPTAEAVTTNLTSGALNARLSEWWSLDVAALRAELEKCLAAPLTDLAQPEWEGAFRAWQAGHSVLTARLIEAESEIDDRVYHLFGLGPADRVLLAEHARSTLIDYPYGAP
jgi:hypothetical protein